MRLKSSNVSVIIPAYKAAATIGRALKSALAQHEVAQCIVIDDASQDETVAAAREADDGTGRLRIIQLQKNAGPAMARNLAIDECRSDMVCVLDADDYFVDGRLSRLLDIDLDYDFVADNILIVPEECDNPEVASHWDAAFQRAPRERPLKLNLERFVRGNIPRRGHPRSELGFLKPIMRQSFLKENGLRYQPRLRFGEDYAFYVEALMAGARFLVVGPCGYVAVERINSLSSSHSAVDLSNLVEFDHRCLENKQLEKRERAALELHLDVVEANADFRHVLRARSEYGLAAGVAQALRRPYHLPYMISETLNAKWRAACGMYRPLAGIRGERFLLNAGFWTDREVEGAG